MKLRLSKKADPTTDFEFNIGFYFTNIDEVEGAIENALAGDSSYFRFETVNHEIKIIPFAFLEDCIITIEK